MSTKSIETPDVGYTNDVASRVWPLVNVTHGDPLAPFAMAAGRQYVFSADGTAAVSYRAVSGFAVVAGDPIGDPGRYGEVVGAFVALCHAHHWHIAVLGASRRQLGLWHRHIGDEAHLTAVPIGRDVVIDVDHFSLTGRRKRNLRQAVQRTRNAGVTTEVIAESAIDDGLRAELREVMHSSGKDVDLERGFSMMLGDTLAGTYPGVWLVVARNCDGRVEGFHRYACAGGGSDVSLDLPWRRHDALNGIDERLSIDMFDWAKAHGAHRVSLAFAPFPELFEPGHDHRAGLRTLQLLAHLGDRFIKLESLYRYVHKFDAMDQQRYVLFPALHIGHALAVLLALEFGPHRA